MTKIAEMLAQNEFQEFYVKSAKMFSRQRFQGFLSLLPNNVGKVDLIYIDPPFDVGADFSMSVAMLQAALRYGDDLQDEGLTNAT